MQRIKRLILKWAVRDLLNAVTIDDLLRVENGKVFIGKRELTREEIATLQSEAKSYASSLLWQLIKHNLYWIANFKMMRGANCERDMDGGRMLTLMIDTVEEFLERLRTLK